MSAAVRIVRALGAGLVIFAVVAGIPVALWWLAAPQLGAVLDGGSVVEVLLRPDDGALLLSVLALVAGVAWLVLTVSIVGELGAAAARRPAPRIDLPGFRLGGAVAAALVAALLSTGPALADPGPPRAPVTATAPAHPGAAASTEAAPGPEHVVAPRDTLWRIAEARLGDPLRWPEIYDLNAGRTQPDGEHLSEDTMLTPGWVLVLPADASTTITVEPGDTLHGLAADLLGDPDRADELFDRNAGVPQPGGQSLTSPGQIRPGWTLALPDEDGAEVPSPGTARVPESDRSEVRPGLPGESSESPTSPSVPSSSPLTSPPSSGPSDLPTTGPPTPAPTDGTERTRPVDGQESFSTAVVLPAAGITAVLAAGVLAALSVRRRRQQRHRPHGHLIAVPGDEPGRLEWTARQEAEPGQVDPLDLALRSLAHPDLRPDRAPQVRLVERSATAACVRLAGPTILREPFEATGDPSRWELAFDTELPVPEDDVAGYGSPFPALVTVAADGDRTLLVDLEQRGVLRLGGDLTCARALLRHIAAELATNAAAEDVETLVVGLGEEPTTFNPDRVVVEPDVATGVSELERRAVRTRMELSRLRLASTVEGRLHHNAAGSWLPTVLLVGHEPDEEEMARIDELLGEETAGSTAVAVVLLDPARPDMRVGDDGLLDLDEAGGDTWQAVQLSDADGSRLAELLDATDDPAVPAGPADGPEPWRTGMGEDGSLGRSDGEVPGRVAPDPEPPPDDHDPADEQPRTDPEALRRLAVVDHQDPGLDDDLRAWHDDAPPTRPMIGILGDPVVRGAGPRPSTRPSWFAEVLVYLSLHQAGVTQAKAATDLWPDGHRISPATIRHAFYGARRWAGRGLDDEGATFVSDLQHDNSYRLRGHLLDWDLFRRLRKRGQARYAAGHTGAVADYQAALDLVRGPVLGALRPGGYAWLNNHDQRHDLQIPGFVVDTAHELVDIALSAGDPALARRAAERARAVDVDVAFDRPLTDLMRVAHAEDNQAELELYGSILLDARGFEVPEELAPESFTVLNELLPTGPRRSRP